MVTWSGQQVLDLWTRGARRHAVDRALLLASAGSTPPLALESLADLPLGVLRRRLLAIRRANFGARLLMSTDCPSCATQLELTIDADALPLAGGFDAGSGTDASDDVSERSGPYLDVEGRRLRLPTSRDLAAALAEPDLDAAERTLVCRCVADDRFEPTPEWLAAAERELAACDDGADVMLDLSCGECGHAWQLPFDVGVFLWHEVEVKARALLGDVHVLARAYGWTEDEVLALPEPRRAAYIAMVSA